MAPLVIDGPTRSDGVEGTWPLNTAPPPDPSIPPDYYEPITDPSDVRLARCLMRVADLVVDVIKEAQKTQFRGALVVSAASKSRTKPTGEYILKSLPPGYRLFARHEVLHEHKRNPTITRVDGVDKYQWNYRQEMYVFGHPSGAPSRTAELASHILWLMGSPFASASDTQRDYSTCGCRVCQVYVKDKYEDLIVRLTIPSQIAPNTVDDKPGQYDGCYRRGEVVWVPVRVVDGALESADPEKADSTTTGAATITDGTDTLFYWPGYIVKAASIGLAELPRPSAKPTASLLALPPAPENDDSAEANSGALVRTSSALTAPRTVISSAFAAVVQQLAKKEEEALPSLQGIMVEHTVTLIGDGSSLSYAQHYVLPYLSKAPLPLATHPVLSLLPTTNKLKLSVAYADALAFLHEYERTFTPLLPRPVTVTGGQEQFRAIRCGPEMIHIGDFVRLRTMPRGSGMPYPESQGPPPIFHVYSIDKKVKKGRESIFLVGTVYQYLPDFVVTLKSQGTIIPAWTSLPAASALFAVDVTSSLILGRFYPILDSSIKFLDGFGHSAHHPKSWWMPWPELPERLQVSVYQASDEVSLPVRSTNVASSHGANVSQGGTLGPSPTVQPQGQTASEPQLSGIAFEDASDDESPPFSSKPAAPVSAPVVSAGDTGRPPSSVPIEMLRSPAIEELRAASPDAKRHHASDPSSPRKRLKQIPSATPVSDSEAAEDSVAKATSETPSNVHASMPPVTTPVSKQNETESTKKSKHNPPASSSKQGKTPARTPLSELVQMTATQALERIWGTPSTPVAADDHVLERSKQAVDALFDALLKPSAPA